MHTQKKKRLIKSVLSMAIIAGAAGAATGTYAWYSYQKEVNTELRGTTIKADKEIQIGLRWDSDLPLTDLMAEYSHGEIEHLTGYNVGGEDCDIYWIRGNYVSNILKSFHDNINCAETSLHPITAGKYQKGDIDDGSTVGSWTNFWRTPAPQTPGDLIGVEDYHKTMGVVNDYMDYFYLPLAFRVLDAEPDADGNLKYVNNENIFLSKFEAVDLTRQEIEDEGENSNPVLEAKREKDR